MDSLQSWCTGRGARCVPAALYQRILAHPFLPPADVRKGGYANPRCLPPQALLQVVQEHTVSLFASLAFWSKAHTFRVSVIRLDTLDDSFGPKRLRNALRDCTLQSRRASTFRRSLRCYRLTLIMLHRRATVAAKEAGERQ